MALRALRRSSISHLCWESHVATSCVESAKEPFRRLVQQKMGRLFRARQRWLAPCKTDQFSGFGRNATADQRALDERASDVMLPVPSRHFPVKRSGHCVAR